MTSKTKDNSHLAFYLAATWVIGCGAHMIFQSLLGTWYDGLVFNLGYTNAVSVFLVTFISSTLMAMSAERHFNVRTSLSRCLIHLATGFVVVPVMILFALTLFGPELSTVQTLTVAGLDLLFALTTWGFTLVSSALLWEVLRGRS